MYGRSYGRSDRPGHKEGRAISALPSSSDQHDGGIQSGAVVRLHRRKNCGNFALSPVSSLRSCRRLNSKYAGHCTFWEMFQFSISSRDLECGLDAHMGIQQYSVLFSAGEQEPRFTPSVSQSKSFFITSVRPSLITRSVSTSGGRLISPAGGVGVRSQVLGIRGLVVSWLIVDSWMVRQGLGRRDQGNDNDK